MSRWQWKATDDPQEIRVVQSAMIKLAANMVRRVCGVDGDEAHMVRSEALTLRDLSRRLGKNHPVPR